ncbi:MAG: ferritin family protein [Thiotrichaceae bacterium]
MKGKTTLQEILHTASQFELTAFTFYDALKDKVGKNLRPLVEELVHEEQRHFTLFQELSKQPDVQAQIAEKIQVPLNDHRFSDYIQLPKLEDFADDQSILQYALGREQAAMEQYFALAKETPDGAIQDLFRYLAQEELEHKKELEKRYYELVHSGGV